MILPTFVSWTGIFIFLGVVRGQFLRNITIDNTDETMITYHGSWYPSTNTDSFANRHSYTSSASSYATFNFTGVAVYYMMPLFSGYTDGVSTLLTLDGGSTQWVNLTRAGSEPTTSAVRWSQTGLQNGNHTVMISLGRSPKGELATWGLVDAFIYTVADPSPVSSTAPTATQAPATNNVRAIQKCQPCGKSTCAFSPQGSASYDIYRLVVGQPVSNCDRGTSSNVTSQFTKETTVSQTWSLDATIGVEYAGMKVEVTAGWENSVSRKAGQTVTMSIPPGKMGALTANVSYKKTHGSMRIDSDSYDFASIQPTDVGGYNVEYADCGGLFNAFTLSSVAECDTSASAGYTNRCSLVLVGLMGIMVWWNMI